MDTFRFERIESVAPALPKFHYELTSSETDAYNCIAWAVGDITQWWWPSPRYACYWPPGVPRDNTLGSVTRIFELHGYSICDHPMAESGFEKVALYEHPLFDVEHVARQLKCGHWPSKIGEWEDIKHESPSALDGDEYGKAVRFMKRPRKDWTT